MKDISDKNFGPLIAFCLPGFILLLALSYSFPDLKDWLVASASKDGASVGGFLYSTLASLSLGLLLSGLRWATVDQVLEREFLLFGGERLPEIDFKQLDQKDKLAAFLGVVENHYRYYQYYSNSLVAVELGGLSYLYKIGNVSLLQWVLVLLLAGILYLASRDCFRKFRVRGAAVTTQRAKNDERVGTPGDRQAEATEDREEGQEGEEGGEEDGEEDQESGEEEKVDEATSRQPRPS